MIIIESATTIAGRTTLTVTEIEIIAYIATAIASIVKSNVDGI